LCFNHNDYLRGFCIQHSIVETLWKYARDGHDFFGRLFLSVAEKYLHTHFHAIEAKGNTAITIINFDIPNTLELQELRKTIWAGIFRLYIVPELQKQALDTLYNYISSRLEVSSSEIIKYDSSMVLQFIENDLDPTVLHHCIIVQEYLDLLRNYKVDFDEAIPRKFESEIWSISQLLTLDFGEMRTLHMDYEEFNRYKWETIKEHFFHYTLVDYERFFNQCSEIYIVIDQDHKKLQLQNGIINVFLALAETNSDLFIDVLEKYLLRGEQFKINAGSAIKQLIEIAGIERSFGVLNGQDYPTKRTWLLWWHMLLPTEAVNMDRLNHLYMLYLEANHSDLINNLDFLLKYLSLDRRVVIRITEIILDKVKTDPAIAHALYWLFNPYMEINKVLEDVFAENIPVLKQAYFAASAFNNHMDYDGHTLSRIMDLDENFIIEYIDRMYKAEEHISRHHGSHDYSFIWKRCDFEKVIGRIAEWIYDQEKEAGLLSFTVLTIFFKLKEDGQDKLDLEKKQNQLLSQFIENRHEDVDFVKMVFSVIAELPPLRRASFVSLFLKHNKDFKAFKSLALEPYIHSWSGSTVPILQERLEYLESLLSFTNTVELLQHKQYLEQNIQGIRSQIEHEKKRDFIGR
jgi:hypothetical protein